MDKRTLEKYEREAKEKNRETWYLSWALDTNQEERDKVDLSLPPLSLSLPLTLSFLTFSFFSSIKMTLCHICITLVLLGVVY